jgi:hypothetical protein
VKEGRILLFLKKKKQKDFYFWGAPNVKADYGNCPQARRNKSFFASFFSKKEDSFFPSPAQ